MYDVASALMYVGGRAKGAPFWDAYVRYSHVPASELTEHLGAVTRFPAAVQAAYFSMRVATADPTGVNDQDGNWKGLRDAEQLLRANGAEPVTSSRDRMSMVERFDVDQASPFQRGMNWLAT